jgi:molybdenum cofactor cytidylyltransferase
MTIAIVVLAAGSASRFGRPKLLEELDGRPLVQHALASARSAALGPVYLVTGHDDAAVRHAASGLADRVVFNPSYADGMGTSIACGVTACREVADAILLMLADQPHIGETHLRQLADTWSGASNEIVASAFADVLGPPVLFGNAAFEELAALEGDRGAKSLLRDERFTVRSVRCDAAGLDIDTEADLDAARRDQ